MSVFLIDEINEQFNTALINQISHVVNSSDNQVQSAISHIVPHFLMGFEEIAARKLGAKALFQAITTQDDSILDDLSDQLNEEKHKSFENSGSFSLNTLFGARKTSRFSSTTSTASGLNSSASSTLLGTVMPIALSVIKRRLSQDGEATAQQLLQLLHAQKESLFEWSSENPVGKQEDDVRTPTKESAAHSQKKHSGTSRKLLTLLLLSIIALFAYQWYLRASMKPISLPDLGVTQAALDTEKKDLTAEEADSLVKLSDALDSVIATLSEITDIKTANSKRNELLQHAHHIDMLSKEMTSKIKPEAAKIVSTKLPQMQVYYDRIRKIPEGKSIIEPQIDRLIKQLVNTFI